MSLELGRGKSHDARDLVTQLRYLSVYYLLSLAKLLIEDLIGHLDSGVLQRNNLCCFRRSHHNGRVLSHLITIMLAYDPVGMDLIFYPFPNLRA